MRRKILIINSCSECGHASVGTRVCKYHSFLKNQRPILDSLTGGIPDWCPLPDAHLTSRSSRAVDVCPFGHCKG